MLNSVICDTSCGTFTVVLCAQTVFQGVEVIKTIDRPPRVLSEKICNRTSNVDLCTAKIL